MRLFIGIGLPASVAEALAKSAVSLIPPASASKIRWTPPANMHITLSFLGQVHPARLDVIQQALATVSAPGLRLELDGVGVFDRAGVIFAKVKLSPELLALAEQVIAAMEAYGFAREKRPWSPHITLARTRERIRLLSTTACDSAFHQSFEADEFRLYQSLTLPAGAQYEVLNAFPLD
jgi:RNA 2',3'-cyclic 3'-phosphodiesterase